ncbi:MAG: serine hydrolase domain-containing protein [Candidatus Hodarchaeales archaeon]|jgi:CubicO group peptidase (beta-lactamase class C family)
MSDQKFYQKEVFTNLIQELKREIKENMEKYNIPGLTIALVTTHKPIWIAGFGFTDRTHKQRVNEETLVGLQSTTKTFTAIVFLRAVQKGLVKLDDYVVDILPDFSVKNRFENNDIRKITFRHLLSHRSGLTSEAYYGGVFDNTEMSFAEHVVSVSHTWLEFPIDERLSYSNIGMDIVAYALEHITGMSYPQFVKKELLDPLGITSLVFESEEAFRNLNSFKGHVGTYEPIFTNISSYGCGSGFISPKDLLTFMRFLLRRGKTENGISLITSELFDEMEAGEDGSYGLGVFITNFGQIRSYNHAGGGFGYNSEMYWIPEYGIGVAVQSNQEYQPYTNELAKKTIRSMLNAIGVEIQEIKEDLYQDKVVEINKSILNRYVGYYSGLLGKKKVFLKDEKLIMLNQGKEVELQGLNETEFTSKDINFIKFEVEKDKCKRIKFHYGIWGHIILDYLGKGDINPYQISEEFLKKYIGLYKLNYYENEENYFIIDFKEGFLYNDQEKLFKYDNNVFHSLDGQVIEFKEDEIRTGGIKGVRIETPVDYFTKIAKTDPKSRYLQSYALDNVINLLKSLNRNQESDMLQELKASLRT